ncbi:DUF349 domain-containing protein [Humidisolicoccus flavus]|uniref:DUF349 domain-containing protein n=1 Tax=Humidisolicoccus flavus TaxID=3111414 RepID=UPI00324EC418
MQSTDWGRVDESGTVFVREGETWREVGQYPGASSEEALAYFTRKFQDLAGQVVLLEQRSKAGANPSDIDKAAKKLLEAVNGANAVGDLAALTARLDVLHSKLGELSQQQQAEVEAARSEAIAERTALVEQVEALAAQDPKRTQWKATSQQLDAHFATWQEHQKNGPRLPKATADALWARFRTARQTIESNRRAHFSELDAQGKQVRERKQAIIERAQALAPKGADGIPAYRSLLDEWKAAGRAGRKADDALWASFKAAGDVLYDAKSQIVEAENEEYTENLTAKQAILADAAPILKESDRVKAREALTAIQRRWDAVGKVPRDSVRSVEDQLRKIETHVKQLEDSHWANSNPERKARSAGLAGQLEDAIAQLEEELNGASAARAKEIEAELATKRQWLEIAQAAG